MVLILAFFAISGTGVSELARAGEKGADCLTVGLREDGSVYVQKPYEAYFDEQQARDEISRWTGISKLYSDSLGCWFLGLREDGTLSTAGSLSFVGEISRWIDIDSVYYAPGYYKEEPRFLLGLRTDGTVASCGDINLED